MIFFNLSITNCIYNYIRYHNNKDNASIIKMIINKWEAYVLKTNVKK